MMDFRDEEAAMKKGEGGEETDGCSLEQELERLSHEELCEVTESSLRRLIATDRLLSDLPGDVTTEEVLSQVAVAYGRSITVTVLRHDEKPLRVVIGQQGTTVRELKKAVQRALELVQRRGKSRTKVSWRYVWRTHHLHLPHTGVRLDDDSRTTEEYGVRNHSELTFVKRLQVRRSRVPQQQQAVGGRRTPPPQSLRPPSPPPPPDEPLPRRR